MVTACRGLHPGALLHERGSLQPDGRKYLKPDLVIIDDKGLRQLPKHSGECLLEVIMRRHENRSNIMISNRPPEEWAKLLCEVPMATGSKIFLQNRLLHRVTTAVRSVDGSF
jgi:DNA replication protein DnaC